jgi:hypothetical protein
MQFFMGKNLFITLLFLPLCTLAQIGGNGSYHFLNQPSSPRATALGGILITLPDGNVDHALMNPAQVLQAADNKLSTSFINHLADINAGNVTYGKHFDEIGTFFGGVHYINYGDFEETLSNGDNTGRTFSANDVNFYTGISVPYKKIQVGATVKGFYSAYDNFFSSGLAMDFGSTYSDSSGRFTAGLVAKNAGFVINKYNSSNSEDLPLEIQLGFSQKLENAPFRFTVLLHNLQQFDLTYIDNDPRGKQIDLVTGEPIVEEISTIDKAFRHVNLGTEAIFSESFQIRVGYNHLKRKELTIEDRMSTVGFSWGFGIRVSKFLINYGNAKYHLAGSSHQFGISLNLNEI